MLCLTLPVIQRNLRMVEINKYYYYYYYYNQTIWHIFCTQRVRKLKNCYFANGMNLIHRRVIKNNPTVESVRDRSCDVRCPDIS